MAVPSGYGGSCRVAVLPCRRSTLVFQAIQTHRTSAIKKVRWRSRGIYHLEFSDQLCGNLAGTLRLNNNNKDHVNKHAAKSNSIPNIYRNYLYDALRRHDSSCTTIFMQDSLKIANPVFPPRVPTLLERIFLSCEEVIPRDGAIPGIIGPGNEAVTVLSGVAFPGAEFMINISDIMPLESICAVSMRDWLDMTRESQNGCGKMVTML
ncbi:hypothetical protein EDD85DRAFT_796272 [Armillaria nabsnona]|nr:hypothetical protein EDD85DRAFT_796272 [Armillaria nabsnona]